MHVPLAAKMQCCCPNALTSFFGCSKRSVRPETSPLMLPLCSSCWGPLVSDFLTNVCWCLHAENTTCDALTPLCSSCWGPLVSEFLTNVCWCLHAENTTCDALTPLHPEEHFREDVCSSRRQFQRCWGSIGIRFRVKQITSHQQHIICDLSQHPTLRSSNVQEF